MTSVRLNKTWIHSAAVEVATSNPSASKSRIPHQEKPSRALPRSARSRNTEALSKKRQCTIPSEDPSVPLECHAVSRTCSALPPLQTPASVCRHRVPCSFAHTCTALPPLQPPAAACRHKSLGILASETSSVDLAMNCFCRSAPLAISSACGSCCDLRACSSCRAATEATHKSRQCEVVVFPPPRKQPAEQSELAASPHRSANGRCVTQTSLGSPFAATSFQCFY